MKKEKSINRPETVEYQEKKAEEDANVKPWCKTPESLCSVALRAMEGSSKAWNWKKMDQMEVRKGDHQYASPILQSQATTLSHNRMRYLIHSVVKLVKGVPYSRRPS